VVYSQHIDHHWCRWFRIREGSGQENAGSCKGIEGTGLGLSITYENIKTQDEALEDHLKKDGPILSITINKS